MLAANAPPPEPARAEPRSARSRADLSSVQAQTLAASPTQVIRLSPHPSPSFAVAETSAASVQRSWRPASPLCQRDRCIAMRCRRETKEPHSDRDPTGSDRFPAASGGEVTSFGSRPDEIVSRCDGVGRRGNLKTIATRRDRIAMRWRREANEPHDDRDRIASLRVSPGVGHLSRATGSRPGHVGSRFR